uniref:Protein PHLOEM PROTEIN 2-LIKE A2 n=1 Tax=Solanum tuberosum TaxID=4113 RepID=M1C9B5_SOLTU
MSAEIAVMGEVKLLSVHGSFNAELLSPDTKYKVEFVLRFRTGKHVSGWSKNPVRSVLIPPGKTWNEAIQNKVNLAEKGSQKSFEILAGEFFNPQFNSHGEIQFHLDENKEWKTGLVIKGIRERRKEEKEEERARFIKIDPFSYGFHQGFIPTRHRKPGSASNASLIQLEHSESIESSAKLVSQAKGSLEAINGLRVPATSRV